MALAAAGYGVKKGVDAKEDFDHAERINKRAERIFDDAQEALKKSKKNTNTNLEKLGKLKAHIYEESLGDFVGIFSKIKNIDFSNNLDLGIKLPTDYQEMVDFEESVIEINEIIGGTLAAAGGGALAGFGALGGVGMLASASTGTAIASLSGVAATNATLAWLGGGALSAGGFGMAGGMAVLGGVVAGPVLAIGGAMMASKAEEAKYEAKSNKRKAEGAAEEMDVATVVLDEISTRTKEFHTILKPMNRVFEQNLQKLEEIVATSEDYSRYEQEDKECVMITVAIAKTVKNVCDAPIIDENGVVTKKSKEVIEQANTFMQKLKEV
jgi:hypothetical protein